jgi:hypothetical protein
MSPSERKALINRDCMDMSLTRQCKLLKISRSSLYYASVGVNTETLEPPFETAPPKWSIDLLMCEVGWICERKGIV